MGPSANRTWPWSLVYVQGVRSFIDCSWPSPLSLVHVLLMLPLVSVLGPLVPVLVPRSPATDPWSCVTHGSWGPTFQARFGPQILGFRSGPQLGAKLAPSWLKLGSNLAKSCLHVGSSWAHVGAKLAPSQLKLMPSWAQVLVHRLGWALPGPFSRNNI